MNTESALSQSDGESLREYLRSPTRTGLWSLAADWSSPTGIADTLLQQLESRFTGRKTLEIQSAGRAIRVPLSTEQKRNFREIVTTKLSFIHYLFLALRSRQKRERPIPAEDIDRNYEPILSLLDMPALRKQYKEALAIFSQNIYHKGFHPRILRQAPFFIKSGYIVIPESSEETRTLVSLSAEPLAAYERFFGALGKASVGSLQRAFSPEEVVFAPYFLFLKLGEKHVIPDAQRTPLLSRAFEEYSTENFRNCIGTIGLLAEDYLERVFETLFREPCPKNLTLGQTYDTIHGRIRKQFERAPRQNDPLEPLFQEIRSALEANSEDNVAGTRDSFFKLIRRIVTVIQSDRVCLTQQLDSLKKTSTEISCFSKELREQLTDLIRFRNAVSHKTRIPIGAYEALRSMYCFVNFVMWWHAETESIDWQESQASILRNVIERNSGVFLRV